MSPSGDRGAPGGRRRPTRLSEAVAFIERGYGLTVGTEVLDLGRALGRILARDLLAEVSLPRFDAAAVDGFALRAADLSPEGPSRLTLVGRSAAGHPGPTQIAAGKAVRIFTGAPLPGGADLVVMQEGCRVEGPRVTIPAGSAAKRNIRRAGEDVPRGSLAIARGTRLSPGYLALAAALGYGGLPVRRRLTVALFSTGDELAAPEPRLAAGRIADANRPLLNGLLSRLGCRVEDRGILPDSAEAQIAALAQAARESDLLVTSGGMSVGEEDHLPRVIRRRGYLEVWRLRIKPGKPVGLGDIDDCPILALPGNPVAAAVTFLMLGTPLVARLGGDRESRPARLRLPLGRALDKRPGRWEARPARLVPAPEGCSAVEPLKAGSAMLGSLAEADGFLCLPEAAESLRQGEPVDFIPLPR